MQFPRVFVFCVELWHGVRQVMFRQQLLHSLSTLLPDRTGHPQCMYSRADPTFADSPTSLTAPANMLPLY